MGGTVAAVRAAPARLPAARTHPGAPHPDCSAGVFGNRVPSTQGGLYPTKVEVPKGAALKLVGPRGPVSAAGLYFENSKSPYDGPTTGA